MNADYYFGLQEEVGRVKGIDIITGRIDLANKEKTFVYLPLSRLREFFTMFLDGPYMKFKVDGKCVVSFTNKEESK
jgi:hypothetical protein